MGATVRNKNNELMGGVGCSSPVEKCCYSSKKYVNYNVCINVVHNGNAFMDEGVANVMLLCDNSFVQYAHMIRSLYYVSSAHNTVCFLPCWYVERPRHQAI